MYVITMCAPQAYPYNQGKRVVKIAQNPDGSPGTVTRVLGDCTYAPPNFGASAYSSPLGEVPYAGLSSILPVGDGSTIYFVGYPNRRWKIVNGTVYSVSFASNECRSAPYITYNPINNKLYRSNVNCGIDEVTMGGAQNGGEITNTLFNGNNVTPGCTQDGVLISNACTKISWVQSFNGTLYFADGVDHWAPSNFQVRYIDGSSKIRTALGGRPFFGDGMDKAVMRSRFAGIYYKKSSEPNQAAFPEGLYFMEPDGGVFGRIDPLTEKAEVLWGNQARTEGGYAHGDVISKDMSMGSPYGGGSLMPLSFDSTGLPWLRVSNTLVKINSSKQIELKTADTGYWHNLPDGANPASTSLYVSGGDSSFTFKNQGLFLVGAGYIYPNVDPKMTIRLFDFGGATSVKLLGGNHLESEKRAPSADVGAGLSTNAPLWYACYNGVCHSFYDETTDRLYFNERYKVRYITTPSNSATSALVTLFQSFDSAIIHNFTMNPSRTQVWYATDAQTLRCHDLSSGKSWCDGVTNHFQSAADGGLKFSHRGANIFTWKDDNTLFISTYGGEILQYNLPTAP